jgi:hypothetical protein
MAKKPAAAPPQARGRGKGPAQPQMVRKNRSMLYILLFIPVALFTIPTWIVIFFGLMPTMVALIIDRSRYRYAWIAVGGLNFAGTAPYLVDMWFGQHNIGAAINILTDPFKLIVMYGAAGMGWALCMAFPPIVGAFIDVAAQRKIASLRGDQQKLISLWGKEVTGEKEE